MTSGKERSTNHCTAPDTAEKPLCPMWSLIMIIKGEAYSICYLWHQTELHFLSFFTQTHTTTLRQEKWQMGECF